MSDTIKVTFDGHTRIRVAGEMELPKALFDDLSPDEAWSDEIEREIRRQIDGRHYDDSSLDNDDVEFDDIVRADDAQSGDTP